LHHRGGIADIGRNKKPQHPGCFHSGHKCFQGILLLHDLRDLITATINSTVAWTHYESVIEDSVIFLLRYGKSMYSVIPKRVFAAEDDLCRFREMIRSRIRNYLKQKF
jgi:hypothetical protein